MKSNRAKGTPRRDSTMTTITGKLCTALALLIPSAALAATQSVTETGRYVLNDNDSKNDARQMCVSIAKRTALDKAGSLFESDLTAHRAEGNGKVADDAHLQMRSYVAAVVRSEMLGEHFEMIGDRLAISCTVRLTFDPDEVNAKLRAIAGTSELSRKLAAQQAEMDILEHQVQSLSAKTKVATIAPPAPGAPVPLAAMAMPAPTDPPLPLERPNDAATRQAALQPLPPPLDVPSRPITTVPETAPTMAPAVAQTAPQAPPPAYQVPYQAPYQTVTVYPPLPPTVYYYRYYRPAPAYAVRRIYAPRVAYTGGWYYR
ncbi:MAG TPA: hypothetical protein VMU42_10740 [Candidatus Sulfotelmatobacter sp.]|nr:hypothetical protein [Candidatus Sulfotelmatobacter sp.]